MHNPLLSGVIKEPDHYKTFRSCDDLVYSTNCVGNEVLCIPHHITKKYSLTAINIKQVHTVLCHFRPQKTGNYIYCWYWWLKMQQEVDKFCYSCSKCQANKTSMQHPLKLLHPLPTLTKPWSSIRMDFVGPFPKSQDYDYLWVVICHLTSMVHLIPVNTTGMVTELAWKYIREIVHLHSIPELIVSDWDSKFMSKFWHEVHQILGTKLKISTAFHPQMDGATE